MKKYRLKAKVWVYPGEKAVWHFLTVPKKDSEDIRNRFGKVKRGWGSLPVNVTIRKTHWKTSIFPDSKTGTYLLPLKSDVRKKEGLFEGDTVDFSLGIAA